MSEKKRYTKVELIVLGQSHGYFVSTWGNALGCIGDGEGVAEGETYVVSGVEMTEEEFKELDEWEGW